MEGGGWGNVLFLSEGKDWSPSDLDDASSVGESESRVAESSVGGAELGEWPPSDPSPLEEGGEEGEAGHGYKGVETHVHLACHSGNGER